MTRTLSQKRRARARLVQQRRGQPIRLPSVRRRRRRVIEVEPEVRLQTSSRPRPGNNIGVASRNPMAIAGSREINTMRLTSFMRSIVDPFSGTSCVPDGSRNTSCFTSKGIIQVATGTAAAGGNSCGVIFAFDPVNAFAYDNASANATSTYAAASTWNSVNNFTTFQGVFGRWRPVSMGLRITFMLPANSNNGVAVVGQISANKVPSNFNGFNIGTFSNGASYFDIVPLTGTVDVTWRPEDPEDFSFNNFGQNVTLNNIPIQVPVIFCQVFGAAAATTVMAIEYVINWEGEYQSQGTLFGNETANRVGEVGWYEKAMNALRLASQVAVNGMSLVRTFRGL